MAIFEGQAIHIAQSIAADVESIKRKTEAAEVYIDVSVGKKSSEIVISERLSSGAYMQFVFEVADGIAQTSRRDVVDKKGRVIA